MQEILDKVKAQPKTKPFDYNYNTQEGNMLCVLFSMQFEVEDLCISVDNSCFFNVCYFQGAVLFNLHAYDLIDEISNLLNELNEKLMPLWQQMRSIEILSAVLAEDTMANGTKINLDPEEIEWPDGTISKAPLNEKKGRGGGHKKKILQVNMVSTAALFMNMGRKLRLISKIYQIAQLL